jgi:hypothetical protein
MEFVNDSDDWVYCADWIAADADVRRCRRLAAEQYLADKVAKDLMTTRWYLIQSRDFGNSERYLLEMSPAEANLYDRDRFMLADYGCGPMGRDFAEAGLKDPLTMCGNSVMSYVTDEELSTEATLCKCDHKCNRIAICDTGFCGHCGTHELRTDCHLLDFPFCCTCDNVDCCQLSPPSEGACTDLTGHHWVDSTDRCSQLDCRASFCVAYRCGAELGCICMLTQTLQQCE